MSKDHLAVEVQRATAEAKARGYRVWHHTVDKDLMYTARDDVMKTGYTRQEFVAKFLPASVPASTASTATPRERLLEEKLRDLVALHRGRTGLDGALDQELLAAERVLEPHPPAPERKLMLAKAVITARDKADWLIKGLHGVAYELDTVMCSPGMGDANSYRDVFSAADILRCKIKAAADAAYKACPEVPKE